jgi:hypothetical protein
MLIQIVTVVSAFINIICYEVYIIYLFIFNIINC